VSYFNQIGGSSLTDKTIPVSEANLSGREIPGSYVPFRNGNILSIAASWAEAIGAKRIYIGAVEEDSSGYPDCREEFFMAFEKVLLLGTKPETKLQIFTPVIHMNKPEIIKKGIALKVPFNLTWSCYKNEHKACGICDSCALRLRGFRLAGIIDPIEYEISPEY
jgi:7-cyano-7-deazaguanine synthase